MNICLVHFQFFAGRFSFFTLLNSLQCILSLNGEVWLYILESGGNVCEAEMQLLTLYNECLVCT